MDINDIVHHFLTVSRSDWWRDGALSPVLPAGLAAALQENYRDLKMQAVFRSQFACLAFLAPGQSLRRGIYPLLIYYLEWDRLVLAFGVSERFEPEQTWLLTQASSLQQHFKRKKLSYGNSLFFREYTPEEVLAGQTELPKDLDQLIDIYLLQQSNQLHEAPALYQAAAPKALPDSYPLNLILYGPPGTGKTYQALSYALAIVENTSAERINREPRGEVVKRYREYRQNGQIELITFHQNYSYEDFVQGLKPESNAGNLRFKLRDGLLKIIAERAKKQYELYHHQLLKPKTTFEDLLHLVLARKINPETEEVEFPLDEAHRIYKSIIVYEVTGESLIYKRRTKRDMINKDERRELQLQKIKELYEGRDIKESINQKYYEAVVNALEQFEEEMTGGNETGELKNFVLIIDEINRANISRVFGELITLLEKDKRYQAPNEMMLTLPSGESFVLPPNLYLVGTMNTADKSIALIDVALRRRFDFIAMYPDEEMLRPQQPYIADMLIRLNAEILREKKSQDFLIGHSYFIGISEQELPEVFNQRIIPLLLEYFPGRTDTVLRILSQAGVGVKMEKYRMVFDRLNV